VTTDPFIRWLKSTPAQLALMLMFASGMEEEDAVDCLELAFVGGQLKTEIQNTVERFIDRPFEAGGGKGG